MYVHVRVCDLYALCECLHGYGHMCSIVKHLYESHTVACRSSRDGREAVAAHVLSTETHFNWVLEVTGACLALPGDDTEVMQLTVSLYSDWLLLRHRPPPVTSHENMYLQRMVRHMAEVLKDRSHASLGCLERHVTCARAVLQLIWNIIRIFHARLHEESWQVMVDVVIQASQQLLAGPCTGHSLANGLSVSLFRVLFDLWLCAPRWSQSLWARVTAAACHWYDHMPPMEGRHDADFSPM